jgi:hypothetical protein
MSQHSQRTQQGPSWASIIAGAVLVLAAVAVSTWISSSDTLTWREVAGMAGWTLLAVLLTGQVVGRLVERKIQDDRVKRAEERQRADRERNTATWEGDAGEKLTIRYEPETGRYLAEGWISDHWQIHPETEWKDRATLVNTLAELELSGEMTPWDDEGTRAVRARLDLPDWDEELESVTQPAGEPREDWMDTTDPEADSYPQSADPRTEVLAAIRDDLGVADTVTSLPVPVRSGPTLADEATTRLDWPERTGPSAAALRAIEVPVFRTEAERAAWATERDIPTEFLPVQDGRHRPACDVDGATGWCTTHGQYEG